LTRICEWLPEIVQFEMLCMHIKMPMNLAQLSLQLWQNSVSGLWLVVWYL
jgi:hypothetical protein